MCVSEWTVASHTPGYTPRSDTSPACARSPSLLVDAASTGGTWSAKCATLPTNYGTYESSANLLPLALYGISVGVFHLPVGATKAIHQEQDVNWHAENVCTCVCARCSRREKVRVLDECQGNYKLMRASGYQATGKPRQRHLHPTRPWYLAACVSLDVTSPSNYLSLASHSLFTFGCFGHGEALQLLTAVPIDSFCVPSSAPNHSITVIVYHVNTKRHADRCVNTWAV